MKRSSKFSRNIFFFYDSFGIISSFPYRSAELLCSYIQQNCSVAIPTREILKGVDVQWSVIFAVFCRWSFFSCNRHVAGQQPCDFPTSVRYFQFSLKIDKSLLI